MIIALTLLVLFTVALATTPRVRYPNAKREEVLQAEEIYWLQTRPRGKYHSFFLYYTESDCGIVERTEDAVPLAPTLAVLGDIRTDRKVSDLILVGGSTDQMCKNCIRVGANQ